MSFVYIVRRNDELDVYADYDDALIAATIIGGSKDDITEEVVMQHESVNTLDWLNALRKEYGVES